MKNKIQIKYSSKITDRIIKANHSQTIVDCLEILGINGFEYLIDTNSSDSIYNFISLYNRSKLGVLWIGCEDGDVYVALKKGDEEKRILDLIKKAEEEGHDSVVDTLTKKATLDQIKEAAASYDYRLVKNKN